MADDSTITPRTLIKDYLENKEVSENAPPAKRRRSLQQTPSTWKTVPLSEDARSQPSAPRAKRRSSFSDNTPKTTIQNFLDSHGPEKPETRKRGRIEEIANAGGGYTTLLSQRRQSARFQPRLIETPGKDLTPRTVMAGFLRQAVTQTPVQCQRQSDGPALPPIPPEAQFLVEDSPLYVTAGARLRRSPRRTHAANVTQHTGQFDFTLGSIDEDEESELDERDVIPETQSNNSLSQDSGEEADTEGEDTEDEDTEAEKTAADTKRAVVDTEDKDTDTEKTAADPKDAGVDTEYEDTETEKTAADTTDAGVDTEDVEDAAQKTRVKQRGSSSKHRPQDISTASSDENIQGPSLQLPDQWESPSGSGEAPSRRVLHTSPNRQELSPRPGDTPHTEVSSGEESTQSQRFRPYVPVKTPRTAAIRKIRKKAPVTATRTPVTVPRLEKNKTTPKPGTSKQKKGKTVVRPSKKDQGNQPLRMPASLTKGIFSHYAKCKVSKEVMSEVEKIADKYWKNLTDDLGAFANHAGRHTINEADVELLMKRQGFVTEKKSMHALVEEYLPLEYKQVIVPMARSTTLDGI